MQIGDLVKYKCFDPDYDGVGVIVDIRERYGALRDTIWYHVAWQWFKKGSGIDRNFIEKHEWDDLERITNEDR